MLLGRTLNKTRGNAASLRDALEHGGRTRRSQLKTNLGLWIDQRNSTTDRPSVITLNAQLKIG
jgi:hypothetical protein